MECSKRPNSRLPNPRRIGFSNGSSAPHPSVAKLNPHSYAVIPERRPVTEQVFGVIERVTFRTDDSRSACCGKRREFRASRSSRFLISLVEAGRAKQLLSQSLHLCRRFLYLLGTFVAVTRQKSPVFLQQEADVLLNGSSSSNGLDWTGRTLVFLAANLAQRAPACSRRLPFRARTRGSG